MSKSIAQRAFAGTILMGLACGTLLTGQTKADQAAAADRDTGSAGQNSLGEIRITAERIDLIGVASTASEGLVADQELQLSPVYRPGQLLETVPGLVVTLHSGEGKANQYLLRGYNLDHGTDLATYVDGMPINQPTHAHGQGYTDLNFMIPELVDGITYTKGPYYAGVGDFGAVGSVHLSYRDIIADQVALTAGTSGFQRLLTAGSESVGPGHLLAALEVQHYDGPFVTPDDARKENLSLRYSGGDFQDGYSATLMYYHQLWTNTTDIPLRAIAEELVPSRFGTLDPTDGGHAQRASLSVDYHTMIGDGTRLLEGKFDVTGFFIYNQLHIFNDFTHYLFDPVNGDQEDQFENRRVSGGAVTYTLPLPLSLPWGSVSHALANELKMGLLTRYDLLGVGRSPSRGQLPLPVGNDPVSFANDDQVYLFAAGAYVQATTRWTSSVRSVLGLRQDYQRGTDIDHLAALHMTAGYTNGGTAQQSLVQPKGSLIVTANDQLEFYVSAGRGFHSADIRGVDQDQSVNLGLPNTKLLSRQEGQEVGVRAAVASDLTFTFAVFNLWQQSETIIDPDVGQDSAGPPSRRYGYELNVTWQVTPFLEFYGSYSGDHTRFTRPFDDGTGHLGTYITDAPTGTGSLGLYVTHLGPWSGGLDYRYLGNYALSSGPCVNSAAVHDFPDATSCANAPTALGQVNGHGFGELDLDVHCVLPSRWSAALGIYNLLDTHAPAAEFWYVDRLQNEVGTYPNGRADIHQHPLEPLMARLTITKQFGP